MRAARTAWVLLAWLSAAAPAVAAPVDGAQKRVLVVYSSRRDTELPTLGDREMPGLLAQALSVKPDYYSEHIDGARFPEGQYQEAFRDYLRLKYRGIRFDVVIASHKLAYDVVTSVRAE